MWINAGDIILIGLRDYQDTKADVILKYNSDEARNLKAYGELPENGEITDFTCIVTARALLSRYMPWSCVCVCVSVSVCHKSEFY